MANTYYSKYTGAEIDAGIQKTNAIPAVVEAAIDERFSTIGARFVTP